MSWEQLIGTGALAELLPLDKAVVQQVVIELKYAGYVDRQAAQIERFRRHESRRIPEHFNYDAVPQLRFEAREKLRKVRPASMGQAARISGINPADLAIIMMYLDRGTPLGIEAR
jgi:tRNA uridine 5-carboxymethylaminomethyl modification enzyme